MRGRDGESGSAAVELTLVTPLLVLFLLLVVAAGRVGEARNDVYGAASQAARAASLARAPGAAVADARAAAAASLGDGGPTCRSLSVDVDAGALRPGGRVAVTVACAVPLSDLVGLGLPGTRVVSASASEVVDTYRGAG